LRDCREIFRREGIAEIRIDRSLLRVLLREGKLQEAKGESEGPAVLASKGYSKTDALQISIALAQVWAAAGEAPRAIETLHSVLDTTRKYGLLEYSFDARLALGTIQLKSRDPKGRSTLENLYAEAQRRGYRKIARDVEQVLERL
jgi:hypothetical protein